jgi:hypothetical protein
MIAKNLHLAMRHLRSRDTPRTLWIDAICINQVDNGERTSQAQKMRSIYERASRVIVWLGIAPKGIDRVFGYFGGDDDPLPYVNYRRRSTPLSKLLDRPYWDRMWVIQELAVAQEVTVQCGSHTVSWPIFCYLVEKCEGEGHGKARYIGKLRALRNMRGSQSCPFNGLLALAYHFRNKEASDPRDRLFALLRLVNLEALIIPDYSKDADEVSRDFAKAWINQKRSLLIMAFPKARWSNLAWYPSWSEYITYGREPVPFWSEALTRRCKGRHGTKISRLLGIILPQTVPI